MRRVMTCFRVRLVPFLLFMHILHLSPLPSVRSQSNMSAAQSWVHANPLLVVLRSRRRESDDPYQEAIVRVRNQAETSLSEDALFQAREQVILGHQLGFRPTQEIKQLGGRESQAGIIEVNQQYAVVGIEPYTKLMAGDGLTNDEA